MYVFMYEYIYDIGLSQKRLLGAAASSRGAFSESNIHCSGYQAIELIRLTNLTPLLWVRVDPMAGAVWRPHVCVSARCLSI
jgi:hypothetical protein